MLFDFTETSITASTLAECKAAEILSGELETRTGRHFPVTANTDSLPCIVLEQDTNMIDKDSFSVYLQKGMLKLRANGVRGLIFGIGLFLRKTVYCNGKISLISDITGNYSPDKAIRGHQIGYRQTPNTYDAWTVEQFRRYYIEMMFFGVNTVEHIPADNNISKRNELMLYDENDLLKQTSADADELDINVSLWYPNCEKDTQTAVKNRERVFADTPRIDFVFPPGGDPGELPPEELFERIEEFDKKLKQYHPHAGIWPSAQQPHNFADWGERFIKVLEGSPNCIDGIITGPNHAYRMYELRTKTPMQYPIRFYPDITHNVRCEYPVHFDRDDWHYALTTVNSRESVNPRPCEYRDLHKLTRPYVIGSVSYSEGVTDDINKAVWSALDFDPELSVREILEDYARLFFPGCDAAVIADGIFGLEKNWEGSPEENPQIEQTLKLWSKLGEDFPALMTNWRYVSCLFRAECDAFVRRRMLFENGLIAKAKKLILNNKTDAAVKVLNEPFTPDIALLRADIERNGDKLFELIGMQLSTKKHFAAGWERGAVLDTVDLPVTDRPWLLHQYKKTSSMSADEAAEFMKRSILRNKVDADEYYYSVALDGFLQTGIAQAPDFYMDFQGDRPNKNNGSMPVCLQKFYDHFSFRARVGGLTAPCDYILTVTYNNSPNTKTTEHKVTVNGNAVYCGVQYGGEHDTKMENDILPDGYSAIKYAIPNKYLINGCAEILITEPTTGFEIAEFRITKAVKETGA